MTRIRKLPRYEHTIGAVLIEVKEAVIGPMRPRLRDYDITEPQWRVMRLLNDLGAADGIGLAQGGILHAASVARILKELERRGLVEREQDQADRRRNLVRLTPAGYAIVDAVSDDVLRVMEEYAQRFGPERLEWVQNELRALSRAIGDVT